MSAEEIRLKKRALRREIITRVLALDHDQRRRDEALLLAQFPALPGFATARTVLLYATAFPEEIATGPLLEHALQQGKVLLCPSVDRTEHGLRLFRVEDAARQLVRGVAGISEPRQDCREVAPDSVDWVLVPGLGFDTRRSRLGRGAGHYDRLLLLLPTATPRWALIHDCQWVDEVPVADHDIAVDGVVSPSRIIGPGP
jgi:5-formyltetrahydrofolate cyclo-ligase